MQKHETHTALGNGPFRLIAGFAIVMSMLALCSTAFSQEKQEKAAPTDLEVLDNLLQDGSLTDTNKKSLAQAKMVFNSAGVVANTNLYYDNLLQLADVISSCIGDSAYWKERFAERYPGVEPEKDAYDAWVKENEARASDHAKVCRKASAKLREIVVGMPKEKPKVKKYSSTVTGRTSPPATPAVPSPAAAPAPPAAAPAPAPQQTPPPAAPPSHTPTGPPARRTALVPA